MTDDLERLWEDLPVGPAPVEAILRRGRSATAQAPARRLRRRLRVVTALGGVAAAFVAGTVVAGSGGPGGAGAPGAPSAGGPEVAPAAFQGALQAPESCEDLLAAYVDRALDVVGPYGWRTRQTGYDRVGVGLSDDLFRLPRAAGYDAAELNSLTKAAPQRQVNSATGTNVQEAGVDEPDTVKTDGSMLVRLDDAELRTYDVLGDRVEPLGDLDLGDLHDGELLLTGDRVVAIGNDGTPADGYGEPSPQTRVVTVDVSDPASPEVLDTVDYDTSLVSARQHGDDVRLVLSAGLPDLDFVRPHGRGTKRVSDSRATTANWELVQHTTLDDWLPHVSVDGADPERFLDCDRVALPRADLGLDTMAVVGFTADDPGSLESLGLAGSAPMAYESVDHLYLAASGGSTPDGCLGRCVLFDSLSPSPVAPGADLDGTTHVYDFALDGVGARYVGAGEVEGSVADRWAMDEYDGVLRLAVGPTSETGDFNAIVTMQARGDRLVEVGRLDRLGVGEEIKAVRWFDGLAIVVTYRQVDPLYVVDLTDQRRPRLTGELKIPGFSSYLHPLGPRRLVGIGSGPNGFTGQAGLFDVTDLADPKRLDVVSYGRGSQTLAGDDPRQVTWLPGPRVLLTVVSKGYGRRGYVSALSLSGGRMTNRMTLAEYGNDIAAVRAVPLPSGKVALVTGEDVEFLPLP